MNEDPSQDDRYRLALEEARRALDHQATEVASIRGRAVSVASIGSLAAAFVGGLASRDDAPLTSWTWLAVAMYVALVAVSGAILAPWRLFAFAQHASVIEKWASNGNPVAQMERSVAYYVDGQYRRNAKWLDRFAAHYLVGLIFLLAEILFLLLDLRG